MMASGLATQHYQGKNYAFVAGMDIGFSRLFLSRLSRSTACAA